MLTDKNGTKSSIHGNCCLQGSWNRGFQTAALCFLFGIMLVCWSCGFAAFQMDGMAFYKVISQAVISHSVFGFLCNTHLNAPVCSEHCILIPSCDKPLLSSSILLKISLVQASRRGIGKLLMQKRKYLSKNYLHLKVAWHIALGFQSILGLLQPHYEL